MPTPVSPFWERARACHVLDTGVRVIPTPANQIYRSENK